MGVFGDTLKQARAQRGVTLKEAEQATRINRHHLSALEDEHFAVLPPLIYQRGIVRNYASYLGLDPGKLLVMFEEARGGESTADLVAAVKPLEMPTHWAPNFAIIAFMVVMSAIVFAWIYSLSFGEPLAQATVPPAIPTVTPIPEEQLVVAAGATAAAPLALAPGASQPAAASQPSGSTMPQPLQTAPASTGLSDAGQATLGQQAPAAPSAIPTVATAPQTLPPTPTSPPPTSPPVPTVAPAPTTPAVVAPTGPTATIRVVAEGDINVSVVADGVTMFSGWLGAGQASDWFTAGEFQVWTSDGSLTLFENAQTGQEFYMGYGPNETYTLRP